jgi:hypothetical protein
VLNANTRMTKIRNSAKRGLANGPPPIKANARTAAS